MWCGAPSCTFCTFVRIAHIRLSFTTRVVLADRHSGVIYEASVAPFEQNSKEGRLRVRHHSSLFMSASVISKPMTHSALRAAPCSPRRPS